MAKHRGGGSATCTNRKQSVYMTTRVKPAFRLRCSNAQQHAEAAVPQLFWQPTGLTHQPDSHSISLKVTAPGAPVAADGGQAPAGLVGGAAAAARRAGAAAARLVRRAATPAHRAGAAVGTLADVSVLQTDGCCGLRTSGAW